MISQADLARLAQRAYDTAPTWSAPGHVRGCLEMVGGVPVVSVPGTDPRNVLDDLRDLDCVPYFVPGLGYIHNGFRGAALKLWPQVRETLHAGGKVATQVIYTGHSLGGAIALVLAALTLRDGLAGAVDVVTFGAPRVGAQRFALMLRGARQARLYRFGSDPVPLVPRPWCLHLPPVAYMHPRSLSALGPVRYLPELSDHFIRNYVEALDDAAL